MAVITARQKEILQLVAGGFTYREIGNILNINRQTVRNHLYILYKGYRVETKTQAVLEGIRRGHIDLELAYQYVITRRRRESIY